MTNPIQYLNRAYVILLVVLLISSAIYFGIQFFSRDQNITVVFRYDDVSSRSDIEIDIMVINTFNKYQIPLTIGVIPSAAEGDFLSTDIQSTIDLTDEMSNLLHTSDFVEVAQHGYSHQTIRERNQGGNTEFDGLDLEKQIQKINDGRELLNEKVGNIPTTFIPPWNTFDLNTLKALERSDFTTISSHIQFRIQESKSNLKFLPANIELKDIESAIRTTRLLPDESPIIVVLFHAYDFNNFPQNLTFGSLDGLLSWLNQQENIQVNSIQQISASTEDLSIERYYLNNRELEPRAYIPAFFRFYRPLVYLNKSTIIELRILSLILTFLFFMTIFIISLNVVSRFSYYLNNKYSNLTKIFRLGLITIFALFTLYIFRDMKIGVTGIFSLMLVAGSVLGAWFPTKS